MTPAEIDAIDPRTCIHQCHGFSLYAVNGQPLIVRRWTKRTRVDGVMQSEQLREAIGFAMESWPGTATAMAARSELLGAWDELMLWNHAMKGAR